MGIKFIIHPLAHLFLLVLDVFGMNLAAEVFTQHLPDKKRFVLGSLGVAVIILLLDMFVFDFYKTPLRTLILLMVLFLNFKFVSKVSYKNSGIQTGVVFILMIIVEIIMNLFIKLLFDGSYTFLFDNYVLVYGVYLCLFYFLIIIGSMFNLKMVKLKK